MALSTPSTTPTLPPDVGWRFDNTYAGLPDVLFAKVDPATVAAPQVVCLNHGLGR